MYNQVKELLFAALIRSCYHFCIRIPESLLFHPIPSIQFHPFHPIIPQNKVQQPGLDWECFGSLQDQFVC